ELVLLLLRARSDLVGPGLVHVHETCRTGAAAAALGDDPRDATLQRRFHDRRPDLGVDGVSRAVVFDVRDLGHGRLLNASLYCNILPNAGNAMGHLCAPVRAPAR